MPDLAQICFEAPKSAIPGGYAAHQLIAAEVMPNSTPDRRYLFAVLDGRTPESVVLAVRAREFNPRFSNAAIAVPVPAAGTEHAFELRAAPSRRRDRGRRVPVTDPGDRHAWLERKAAAAGFELVGPVDIEPIVDWIARGDNPFMLQACVYRGRLRVTDADLFARAMEQGIGQQARAFGFGMLMLR